MSAEGPGRDSTNPQTTWDGKPQYEPRAVGTTVARYVILEALGHGGMGAVYRAYDPKLRREIALKVLHSGALGDQVLSEARAMAQHSHPALVAVYDADRLGAEVYIAMELVRGSTLATWMSDPQPWREVVSMFRAIATGIGIAHAAGIVHRDIKPANVLLDEQGRPKIADFGLAAPDADQPTQPTPWVDPNERMPALVAGTPAYMPPEQHRGEPVTAASDQFAFCVALHEALYGHRPFDADAVVDLLVAKQEGLAAQPPDRDVPGWLWPIVRRGLAAEPQDRWPSMRALEAELSLDPGRRRRRSAIIAGSAALVAAVPIGQHLVETRARDACSTAQDPAAPWGPSDRDALRSALLGTNASYAPRTAATVAAQFDALAEHWVQSHRRACLDTEVERTITQADARLIDACLVDRGRAIDASVQQLLRDPAAMLPDAVTLTTEIEDPTTCLDLDRLRLAPPLASEIADSPAREEIAADLRRAEVALGTDALDELQLVLDRVDRRLAEEPWPSAGVTAQILRARGMEHRGDTAAAMSGFRAATAAALSTGCDRCAIDPGLRLLGALAESEADAGDVADWATMMTALIERAGLDDGATMADVHEAVGIAHVTRGEYSEARVAFAAAVEIQRRVLGSDHPSVVADEANLAIALGAMGEHDEALALSQRALEATERWLGEGHPRLAPIWQAIGRAQAALGQPDSAVQAMKRALEIELSNRPERHPSVLLALNNLSAAHSAAGEDREALRYAKRIVASSLEVPAADRLLALTNVGWYHLRLEEYDAAETVLAEGLVLSRANPEAVRGGRSISSNLGRVYLAQRRPKYAAEQFERALEIARRAWGEDDPRLAEDWEGLARAELSRGRRNEASVALQRAAALADEDDATTRAQIEDTRARLRAATVSGDDRHAAEHEDSDSTAP
ncbi:MAG: serine/threonine-protein kinase [Myxococcota bacterium]